MNIGVKHSLCLISMLSKMQPSESMPTKDGFEGWKSRRIWAGSIEFTIDDLRSAIGDWPLAIGDWPLAIGDYQRLTSKSIPSLVRCADASEPQSSREGGRLFAREALAPSI